MKTPKTIWFNDLRFTYNEKTKYYHNAKTGKLLHREIFEKYNGKIPDGYVVHHKDHNKLNNEIDNLELIEKRAHLKKHNKIIPPEQLREMREKSAKWHASKEGKEWHKKQYAKYLGEWAKEKRIKTCDNCGSEFETQNRDDVKFCSNKCKSAWRRKSGLDDEDRSCEFCGKLFRVNKYSKTKFCSRSCSKKKYWESRSV